MTTVVCDVRFVRFPVRCPRCGRLPRLRVAAEQCSRYAAELPHVIVLTYQCHVRKCQESYEITAGDFQQAS